MPDAGTAGAVSFILLLYSLGFLPPLTARSWRMLAVSFAAGFLTLAALWWLITRGGGLFAFTMSFSFFGFAGGFLAGCAAKALALAFRAPGRPMRSSVLLIAGYVALPAALVARTQFVSWAAHGAYAALPAGAPFSARPGCERFHAPGRLLDTLVEAQQSGSGGPPPSGAETLWHLRYPLDFEEVPPWFPQPMVRQSQIRFRMHVRDASPVRPEEEKDAQGNWIPPARREPAVQFTVHQRGPVAQAAAKALRISFGEILPRGELPDLQLRPSAVKDLQEVLNTVEPLALYPRQYVHVDDGRISQLVQCDKAGRVPFPHCAFLLDSSGIEVDGLFPLALLPDWPAIRDHVERFVTCAKVEPSPPR